MATPSTSRHGSRAPTNSLAPASAPAQRSPKLPKTLTVGRSATSCCAGGPSRFALTSRAAADSGFAIERVRFDRLVPLAEGFAEVAKYIQAAGRPLTSFCACELRSPAAFTEDGFRIFNEHYVKTLAQWGLFDGVINP